MSAPHLLVRAEARLVVGPPDPQHLRPALPAVRVLGAFLPPTARAERWPSDARPTPHRVGPRDVLRAAAVHRDALQAVLRAPPGPQYLLHTASDARSAVAGAAIDRPPIAAGLAAAAGGPRVHGKHSVVVWTEERDPPGEHLRRARGSNEVSSGGVDSECTTALDAAGRGSGDKNCAA